MKTLKAEIRFKSDTQYHPEMQSVDGVKRQQLISESNLATEDTEDTEKTEIRFKG